MLHLKASALLAGCLGSRQLFVFWGQMLVMNLFGGKFLSWKEGISADQSFLLH